MDLKTWFLTKMDLGWMAFCVFFVKLAIVFSNTPVIGQFLRRLTFMSGSSDVNANLCLFLRALFTYIPDPNLRFDVKERNLGYRFLQIQYRIALWLVERFGLRILPPPLRPLYISYYGRAIEAAKFIKKMILVKGVQQIVILGAGFDTTAYRTRDIRIVKPSHNSVCYAHPDRVDSRYVKVMEVDLPDVQARKLEIMKASMTFEEFDYYTEGVQYLACNFGVQSLTEVLLQNGFDPSKPSAFLWEGVTYYIPMAAIESTLSQIRELLSIPADSSKMSPSSAATHFNASPTLNTDTAKTTTEDEIGCESESSATTAASESYLLIDYMDSRKTLSAERCCWLWALEQKLSHAIGTPFITGVENIDKLLGRYGFHTDMHVTRQDCEAALKNVGHYTDVMFEPNSTFNQNEPHLAVASAFFRANSLE